MKVLVTGAHGFLGQAVMRQLQIAGHTGMAHLGWREPLMLVPQTDAVIHCSKPPSDGIGTMASVPFTYAGALLAHDLTVLQQCVDHQRQFAYSRNKPLVVVTFGSVCAYPEGCATPTPETALWQGYPEAVNAPYGIAKRTLQTLLHAAMQEVGLVGMHLILANVYGPGDRSGHVIPATIRKVYGAIRCEPHAAVEVWGRPEVSRSFLYVEDAAVGIVRALEDYRSSKPLNLAPSEATTMDDLVETVRNLFNHTGDVTWDETKPTGDPVRQYDITALRDHLAWEPTTEFEAGIEETARWLQNIGELKRLR